MRRRTPGNPRGSIQAHRRLLLAVPGVLAAPVGFCVRVPRTIQTEGLTAAARKPEVAPEPEWIAEQELSSLALRGFNKTEQAAVADETFSFSPVRCVMKALAPARAAEGAVS